MKLVGLLVGLVVLCGIASPAWAQGQAQPAPGRPMTGAVDVRPGMVNGQIQVGRGSAALNAKLTDGKPDGTLSFAAPGTFAGTATVGNGALETDAALCINGREMELRWTRGAGLHWQLDDASADPTACTLPSSAEDATLTMAPILFAQQAPSTSDPLQENLLDLLQRLASLLVLSGMLFLFAPGLSSSVTAAARSKPWARLGLGLSLLIAAPVVAIAIFVAGLSGGFWWFGLMLLALYACALPIGLALAGMVVGVALLDRMRQPNAPLAAGLVVGVVLLAVLGQVPVIGGLANVLALIFGLGTLMLAPRQRTPAQPVQLVQPVQPTPALAAEATGRAWTPSEAVTPVAEPSAAVTPVAEQSAASATPSSTP